MKNEEIESIAYRLRKEANMDDSIFCEINKLNSSLGIKVYKITEKNWEEKKFPIGANAVVISKAGERIIILNEHETSENERFSIAHEIGHLYLHAETEKGYYIACRRKGTLGIEKQREDEANYFATCLLMPEYLVRELSEKVPFPSVSLFSKLFGVSEITAERRFNELGMAYVR